MDTTTSTIILYITLFLVVILTGFCVYLGTKLKKFMRGKKGNSLEDIMIELQKGVHDLESNEKEIVRHITESDKRLRKSIRNIEVLRFNPFHDQGSNQSFAIAMLDDDGDGVVVSSLYSRDHVSVFAKPINSGASTYELSSEEKEVVDKAQKNEVSKKK